MSIVYATNNEQFSLAQHPIVYTIVRNIYRIVYTIQHINSIW